MFSIHSHHAGSRSFKAKVVTLSVQTTRLHGFNVCSWV